MLSSSHFCFYQSQLTLTAAHDNICPMQLGATGQLYPTKGKLLCLDESSHWFAEQELCSIVLQLGELAALRFPLTL